MKKIILIFCILFISLENGLAADKIPLFVSISPQKYFVQQIGKDGVDVHVMVPPGADAHTYEPRPRQMVAISKARLYFTIGTEFEEAHLEKIVATNAKLKVVHTDHGIEKLAMATHPHHGDEAGEHHNEGEHHQEDGHDHEKTEHHGKAAPDNHHGRGGLDPHVWLSPPLVKVQAQTILKALQEIDPAHRNEYAANYGQFISDIDQLDDELKKTFADKKGLQFLVFHPAWNYFAHAYGLEQVPVEVEGKDPKPAQLKELIEHARKKRIKVIFAQPQFSTKNAELVAKEIGGQVILADPLAENWLANLREVADKFKSALK